MNISPRSFSSASMFRFAFVILNFALPSAVAAQINLLDVIGKKIEDEIGRQIEQGSAQQQQSATPQQPALQLNRSQRQVAQSALNLLGYNAGVEDGVFGKGTRSAIASYQRNTGQSSSGNLTQQQFTALQKVYKNAVQTGNPNLSRPLTKAELVQFQQNLKTLGYYSGAIDGIAGGGTSQAIVGFLSAEGRDANAISTADAFELSKAAVARQTLAIPNDNTIDLLPILEQILATGISGTVTQKPATEYRVVISFVPRRWVISYPELGCSGTLHIESESKNSVLFKEDLSEGVSTCGRGGYVSLRRSQDVGYAFEWRQSANTGPIVEGVLLVGMDRTRDDLTVPQTDTPANRLSEVDPEPAREPEASKKDIERELSRNEIAQLQRLLTRQGITGITPDGVMDTQTLAGAKKLVEGKRKFRSVGVSIDNGEVLDAGYGPAWTAYVLLDGPSTIPPSIEANSSKDVTGPTDPLEKLTINNLGGVWIEASASVDRSNALQPGLRKSMSREEVIFIPISAGQYRVEKRKSGVVIASAEMKSSTTTADEFLLRFSSNAQNYTQGFRFRAPSPKVSRNGVDILGSKNNFLVRFRPTEAAEELGVKTKIPTDFCSGPAREISRSALREIGIAEKLPENAPDILSNYEPSAGSKIALFGSQIFEESFGKPFNELSLSAKTELFERLRTCALLANSPEVDRALEATILSEIDVVSVDSDLGFTIGRARNAGVIFITRPTEVSSLVLASRNSLRQLQARISEIDASEADESAKLSQKIGAVRRSAAQMLPSDVEAIAISLQDASKKYQDAKQAEMERNSAPLPENTLLLNATNKFFTDNCSRAFLAVQAINGGGNGLSTLLARSFEARGDTCVVNLTTHLFTFNLDRVVTSSCEGVESYECSFVGKFWCKYELNPEFGFSSSTADIDPVCPAVSAVPQSFEGNFVLVSPVRWQATRIDW
ncbi:peptidoglycan-binding domain-containing protein [Roseovarius sp. Pro17]|uniref:peptidoglycan-binding domain-containing protein n=1 Tax=Roseovarius sp. Pro17 TaxID=3108175 RepID=UPI002D78D9AB|nr:peptidoglycan-binding domain-containing protein [Roseovarius sp. Pro17]